jgi:hypothetical protein
MSFSELNEAALASGGSVHIFRELLSVGISCFLNLGFLLITGWGMLSSELRMWDKLFFVLPVFLVASTSALFIVGCVIWGGP